MKNIPAFSALLLRNEFVCIDGRLIRKADSARGRWKAGATTGQGLGTHGYLRVHVLGRAFHTHQIVWAMHHGRWPAVEIDHINGIRTDNRIENLREATGAINKENKRVAQSNNKSRLLGVTTHAPGVYRARIKVEGDSYSLGLFKTPEDAHAAYLDAKRLLHEGNTL